MTLYKMQQKEQLDNDRARSRGYAAGAAQFNKGMKDYTKGLQDPWKKRKKTTTCNSTVYGNTVQTNCQ
jgi:hypothetical protein